MGDQAKVWTIASWPSNCEKVCGRYFRASTRYGCAGAALTAGAGTGAGAGSGAPNIDSCPAASSSAAEGASSSGSSSSSGESSIAYQVRRDRASCRRVCRDLAQGGAKTVNFENRRAAAIWAVSTGSAESRRLQPALGQIAACPKEPADPPQPVVAASFRT